MNWLLKWLSEPTGARPFDKLLLMLSKLIYLALRLIIRAVIGRKRRDELFSARKLQYLNILRIFHNKPILLKSTDYVFWCRTNYDYATDIAVISDVHEPWFLENFHPKSGDLVFDIGAYIGKYSVLAGKSVGKTGKVIAIEPDPDNYRLLCQNVKTNALDDIIFTINAAAWKDITTLPLFVSDVNASIHSMYTTTDNPVQVRTVTVDKIVRDINLDHIDYMKIDTEGAEYDVLIGAKDTINNRKIRCLLLEIHSSGNLKLVNQLLQPLYNMDTVKTFSEQHCYIVARLL